MSPIVLTHWNRRGSRRPHVRLAGHLLGLLATVGGCAADSGGPGSDCNPEPPCELSGTVEIGSSGGRLLDGAYEVALEVGEQSVAFECTVSAADSIGTCMLTDRVGLDGWLVEARVAGPVDAPTAIELELDRSEDDEPGPSSILLRAARAGGGFVFQQITPKRSTVTVDGQSCRRCWYELPAAVQVSI